ncbi:MAG: nitroreductase family protein [Oceanococcus sp.]
MSTIQNSEHINPLLAQRWSPVIFDAQRDVSEQDLLALMEAARWSPSCFNAQPWRFVVAEKSRQPQVWQQIHSVLVEGNQVWTQHAPVLMLGVAQLNFEHNGKSNAHAGYDLGAAAAHLTVEASARGLLVHQMAGLHADKAAETFALDDGYQVMTAWALGYHGDPVTAEEGLAQRESQPRVRKPLDELIVAGGI